MGSSLKHLSICLIVFFLFFPTILFIPKKAEAQVSELTVTKQVNKTHVQRDNPDDREIMYTLTVTTNGYCNAPLDIAILFDRSNSMNEPSSNPPIELAKDASISFINELDNQTDRVSLTTYQTTASLDISMTNNFANVETFIDSIVASGYTDIGDALTLARNDMIANSRGVEEVFVLFTDGVWNRGPDPEPIATSIKNNDGIRIITVGIGPGADQTILQNMASAPSDFYYVEDPADLESTLISIARELQYGNTHIVLRDDIQDILPYVDFVSAEDGGILDGGTIQWDLGVNLCLETSFTTHFIVRVKDTTPDLTDLLNDAVATDLSNHLEAHSNEVTTLVHAPLLAINKVHIPTDITAGGTLEYQIIVTNAGTGNAYAVVIEDTLPELFFDVLENTISDEGHFTGNSIVWNGDGAGLIINGSFAPLSGPSVTDSQHTFSYQGVVSQNITPSTQLVNSVQLTSNSNSYEVFEDTDIVQVGEVLAVTGIGNLKKWLDLGLLLTISSIVILLLNRYRLNRKK